jgi:hypothetical protein
LLTTRDLEQELFSTERLEYKVVTTGSYEHEVAIILPLEMLTTGHLARKILAAGKQCSVTEKYAMYTEMGLYKIGSCGV